MKVRHGQPHTHTPAPSLPGGWLGHALTSELQSFACLGAGKAIVGLKHVLKRFFTLALLLTFIAYTTYFYT
jgi:hypothetical protein